MFRYPQDPKDLKKFAKFIERQKKSCNFKRKKMKLSVSALNAEQERAYKIVQTFLAKEGGNQLLMFIHGVAGTGKTYLLAYIREYIESKFTEKGVIVTAPTGVAAFNVNGETLHSAFGLALDFLTKSGESEIPTKVQTIVSLKEQETTDTSANTGQPDFDKEEVAQKEKSKSKDLKDRLSLARVIIIDEISMVGARTFAYINKKIKEILNSSLPFGGKHVIIAGDIGQLRPIYDIPLFAKYHSRYGQDALDGMKLYQQFETVITLHQVVRQEGREQERFRRLLLNIRIGKFTDSDIELLRTRLVSRIAETEVGNLEKSTHLFPFRRMVKHYNSLMLKSLPNPIHRIVLERDDNDQEVLYVEYTIGARVMLTRNLYIPAGLVNGAKGYIRDIVYEPGETISSVPLFIMVRFDEYFGDYPIGMEAIPIPRMALTWDISESQGHGWIKMGFPLVLAYSSTIHKMQGLTVDRVVINFDNSDFVDHTMMFVAISRVRRLADIVLLSDLSNEFINHLRYTRQKNMILNEEERLYKLANKVN